MKSAQDMPGDAAPDSPSGTMPDNEAPPEAAPETPEISLDMSNPDIGEAFKDVIPGETLTVKSKDDAFVVLERAGSAEGNLPEDKGEEAGEPANGAVGILVAKKMRQ